jgi:hypothetical protein
MPYPRDFDIETDYERDRWGYEVNPKHEPKYQDDSFDDYDETDETDDDD